MNVVAAGNAEIFVEPLSGRGELGLVTKMPLAENPGFVSR